MQKKIVQCANITIYTQYKIPKLGISMFVSSLCKIGKGSPYTIT